MIMACRFGYYVRHVNIVTDEYYDQMQKDYELIYGDVPVGSDREEDYSPAQRALFLYFALSGRVVSTWQELSIL